MKTFPMFIRVKDRPVIIVGGGEAAAQKCRLMLKTEARIKVAWPELVPELEQLARSGRIDWHGKTIGPDLFDGAALVFIASQCPGTDRKIHGMAMEAGAVTNVVDQPELCCAFTPSIVDRDPVVVAVGTEGCAPVLARKIKSQIETMLEPQLGRLAAMAGDLRPDVAKCMAPKSQRPFWRWVFEEKPRRLNARGTLAKAERAMKTVMKRAVETGKITGHGNRGYISVIGAGPGASDLLTLRAMNRLQEADIIFYDSDIEPDVLELARRDARRIPVGNKQHPGNVTGREMTARGRENVKFLQDGEHPVLGAARSGQVVAWLKSGNGEGLESIEKLSRTARNAGIEVEVVPGVTKDGAETKTSHDRDMVLDATGT